MFFKLSCQIWLFPLKRGFFFTLQFVKYLFLSLLTVKLWNKWQFWENKRTLSSKVLSVLGCSSVSCTVAVDRKSGCFLPPPSPYFDLTLRFPVKWVFDSIYFKLCCLKMLSLCFCRWERLINAFNCVCVLMDLSWILKSRIKPDLQVLRGQAPPGWQHQILPADPVGSALKAAGNLWRAEPQLSKLIGGESAGTRRTGGSCAQTLSE